MANKKHGPEQKALIAFLGPTPKNISPFRPKPSVKASCRSPKLKMGGAPGVGVGLGDFGAAVRSGGTMPEWCRCQRWAN